MSAADGMAYDTHLAQRIRELLGESADVSEKRMFGGLAFLVGGRMAVAASREGGLMVRVMPSDTGILRAKPHAGPMVMRGRELDGWVRVAAEGLGERRQLQRWVDRGVQAARARSD